MIRIDAIWLALGASDLRGGIDTFTQRFARTAAQSFFNCCRFSGTGNLRANDQGLTHGGFVHLDRP